MNRIALIVGDWSDDGHGKTETFMIDTNYTQKQLYDAQHKLDELGYEWSETMQDYEDSIVSDETLAKWAELGFIPNVVEHDADGYYDPDSYVELFLALIRHINPDFVGTVVKSGAVNIGGYGLFYA